MVWKAFLAELCREARATLGFCLVLQQVKAEFSACLPWVGKSAFTPGDFLLVSSRKELESSSPAALR